ncbi:WAT1-related protein At5g13670-like [Mangifera indica]|uniref:WAT1-related protein At5g13670-like n=1 Tax=Mangifera indica TaxID=29780 RepID=UPI001CFBC94E|nr:WAT1-related protein At5g13670-like [Mangifera indica]
MAIIVNHALDNGLSPHVLVALRMVVAAILVCPFAIVMERLEIVKLRKLHGQAKIVGTLVAIGGGIIMTFVKGNLLDLPWKNGINIIFKKSATDVEHTDLMKGAGLIVVGLFCWSCFIILQGMMSCSTYLIMGWLMKKRGPVFVTSFNPLGMVLVTIFSSFFLAERLFLGRVLGAAVIIIGLCMVLWGKSKDQRHSNSQNIQDDDAVAAAAQNGPQTAVINGDIESPSQSNVIVDE